MPLDKEETQKVFDVLREFVGENKWIGGGDQHGPDMPYNLDSNGMQPQGVERAWRQTADSAGSEYGFFSTEKFVRNLKGGANYWETTQKKSVKLSDEDKNFFIRDGVIISKEVFDKALAERFPAPPPVSREAAKPDSVALLNAAVTGNSYTEIEKVIKDNPQIVSEPALKWAVNAGYQDMVKTLLNNGTKVDQGTFASENKDWAEYGVARIKDIRNLLLAAAQTQGNVINTTKLCAMKNWSAVSASAPVVSAQSIVTPAAPKQPQPKILNASVAAAASSPLLAARVAPSKEKEKEKQEKNPGFITKLKNRFGGRGSSK